MRTFIVLPIALFVAACGGGGGSSDPTPIITDDPIAGFALPSGPSEYREITAEAYQVIREFDAWADQGEVGPLSTGRVQYEGAFVVADLASGTGFYTTSVNIEADFDRQNVSGSGSDFYYDTNEDPYFSSRGVAVPGRVLLSGGENFAGVFVEGRVDGQRFGGGLDVYFAGPGADVIIGEGFGAIGERDAELFLFGD